MDPLHFECEVVIAAACDRVFAELAEPEHFLGLQPLLTSVEELPAAAGTRSFRATERVPLLGPIALSSRLRVELRPDAPAGRVEFATHAPLGIRLHGAFALSQAAGGTRVVESVRLECAHWLRRFVVPRAIAAQEALLANLKRRMEA